MTITITGLMMIKGLAILACLGVGGFFTYMFLMGLAISENQRGLLSTLLSLTVGVTLLLVYLIVSYQS